MAVEMSKRRYAGQSIHRLCHLVVALLVAVTEWMAPGWRRRRRTVNKWIVWCDACKIRNGIRLGNLMVSVLTARRQGRRRWRLGLRWRRCHRMVVMSNADDVSKVSIDDWWRLNATDAVGIAHFDAVDRFVCHCRSAWCVKRRMKPFVIVVVVVAPVAHLRLICWSGATCPQLGCSRWFLPDGCRGWLDVYFRSVLAVVAVE